MGAGLCRKARVWGGAWGGAWAGLCGKALRLGTGQGAGPWRGTWHGTGHGAGLWTGSTSLRSETGVWSRETKGRLCGSRTLKEVAEQEAKRQRVWPATCFRLRSSRVGSEVL